MTRKPATSAAEYTERTRDENKQRELHPHDTGSLDLAAMRAMPRAEARRVWSTASDADKRGLAIQCIRHGNHGPDEDTIALYLDILECQLGMSEVEQAVCGALERLAHQEAASARTAHAAHLKDDAAFFQRAANAYAKALSFYRTGLRPTPTATGYLLPSQRTGEAPHLLTKDGDWICSCPAGESMHWAKALIIGIEVGYDDLAQLASDTGEAVPPDQPPDEFPDVGPIEPLSLGQRLAQARAARIAA
jgi:hypothetical protein